MTHASVFAGGARPSRFHPSVFGQWLPAVVALLCAAAAAPTAALEAVTQHPVVVTATRTPLSADAALAHVTVIDREDIERAASPDLVTLLRREAGVDMVRGGGLGQQASLFLRGSNSNHVLVLIDGVRVSSANTGGYAWEHLPLQQVERIEIVRGPRAALYGSDAIGGVVQVFTRKPDGVEGSLAVGNHDSWAGSAGIGHASELGRLGVRVSRADSGGINIQRPDGFAFDPDDDGFDTRTVALDGGWTFGSQHAALQGLATDSYVEFDQGESTLDNHSVAGSVAGPLARRWSHALLVAAARETLVTPAFFQRLDSRREQLEWQHSLLPLDDGDAELLFGLAWLEERGTSTATFDGSRTFDARRRNRAAFGAWRDRVGAHALELALRHDHDSVFGGHTTGQAAWGWQIDDGTRVHASHGQGFRAPNFNELYSPGFGGLFAGNPALRPERSHSSEVGLRHDGARAAWSLHAFRTRVRDLVDFSGTDFQAINIRRARIDGVEAGVATGAGPWRLQATATWQDPRDLDTGAPLLRRPPRKASAELVRRFQHGGVDGVEIAVTGYASAARPDIGARLPGYGLLGARLHWPLQPRWALDLSVDNLLDREYTEVSGFNTPGQTWWLALRYAD